MALCIGENPITMPVVLAPMAGLTDRPFRDLVAEFGAGLVVSEMIASAEMLSARPGVREKAEIAAGAANSAVQIAGREAAPMAECARRLAGDGARIIDINMGCPAKKVTAGASGAALMREPEHALRLIDAVVAAVSVPVTLKMRLGWDEGRINAPAIARRAEAAGVRMITVHGRTRCQFYRGAADWAAIRRVAAAVSVPVLANGDVVDAATARRALAQSGAAGLMVGRGAVGAPWRLAEIAAGLTGRVLRLRPEGRGFADLIARHLDAQLAFHGPELGLRTMRKHFDAYLRDVPGAAALRARLVRSDSVAGTFDLIRRAVPDLEPESEAA